MIINDIIILRFIQILPVKLIIYQENKYHQNSNVIRVMQSFDKVKRNRQTKQQLVNLNYLIQFFQDYIYCKMIQEFHKVLRTPKPSTAHTLGKTQDLILCTFEEIFPQSFDLQFLHKIYEEVLGPDTFPGNGQIEITIQQQISLNYRLVEYFISLIKTNFVNIEIYKSLQDQTQKAQSTIRSHIKIEQEMKMYLEYLESKIQKMQKQIFNVNQQPEHLRREILIMQSRQAMLQKQKINLIKRNEKLKYELELLSNQNSSATSLKEQVENSAYSSKHNGYELSINKIKNSDIFPTHQINTKVKESFIKSSRISYEKQSDKQRDKEKQKQKQRDGFRLSGHDYDLTKKKRSAYFPGMI